MKFSTKMKMAVASIRSLNVTELRDLVKSEITKSRTDALTGQGQIAEALAQVFKMVNHGHDSYEHVVANVPDTKVAEAQEATATLVENTAKFLEENEAAAKVVASFFKDLFQDAAEEAKKRIEADESLTLVNK